MFVPNQNTLSRSETCVSVIYMTPSRRTQAVHKLGFRDGISPIPERQVRVEKAVLRARVAGAVSSVGSNFSARSPDIRGGRRRRLAGSRSAEVDGRFMGWDLLLAHPHVTSPSAGEPEREREVGGQRRNWG